MCDSPLEVVLSIYLGIQGETTQDAALLYFYSNMI